MTKCVMREGPSRVLYCQDFLILACLKRVWIRGTRTLGASLPMRESTSPESPWLPFAIWFLSFDAHSFAR